MTFAAHADTWLADVMSRPVFRVDGAGDITDLSTHIGGHRGAFYFAKVSTERVDAVASLTRLGFVVVDTNVTFEYVDDGAQFVVDAIAMPRTATVDMRKPGRTTADAKSDQLNIGELKPNETDAVLDIAGSAFRYSRFHLDPHIDHALAHRIKREWIRNYVLGKRGAGLLVARENGKPIGFLAHLVAQGTAVIDLIAVATDAHGRGAGSALTASFAGLYAGMPRIVGTQVANVPSIRLYTKLGFAFARSQYVLHLHAGT